MLNNIKNILIVALLMVVVSFPLVTRAETYIHPDDVREDWVWDKAGSPYIIKQTIILPKGYNLTIKEGVVIQSAEGVSPFLLYGDLKITGTGEDRVKFNGAGMIYFLNNVSNINNVIFDGISLQFIDSTSTMESITIENTYDAITTRASSIRISSSTLSHNFYGILSLYNRPNIENNFKPRQNIISITSSRIVDTLNWSITNQTSNTVDATDNWWGRKDGPLPEELFGPVKVAPWREIDTFFSKQKSCCSNVLFVPGFEATRLYLDSDGLFGTTTNTLWEPNRSDDVVKLYMDSKGNSVNSSIYPKDIIDTVLGVKDIYKSFVESMDGLVTAGQINKWSPLPYDWRNNSYDISNDGVVDIVRNLASTSKTGKINIVAHSNGGLVTKGLIKKLENVGIGGLVEGVINIAVPELGTTEAVLSMLHGYNQEIGLGLILSENTARTFSQNLPGAYGLLPSRKFFENNPFAIISDLFTSTPPVSTFESMKSFLLKNSFSKASSTDVSIPLLLNPYLLALGDSLHDSIDTWKPASTTHTLSVFGWGKQTSNGILYKTDPHCHSGKLCPVEFQATTTVAGDGTVLTKSNSMNADDTLYLNLQKLYSDTGDNINHANILESKFLQDKIADVLTQTESVNSSYDKYFTHEVPSDVQKYLTIRVHSPIDINIYDTKGRHTGPVLDPLSGRYVSDTKNTIDGGYYRDLGKVKTAIVPYNGEEYKVSLTGTDSGVFLIEAIITQSDTVLATANFSELPVTPLTNINLVLGTTTESFATSTHMQIDVDGDGITDIVSHTNEFLHPTNPGVITDMSTYLESIRKVIISLNLPVLEEKSWLSRLDRLEKVSSKKNPTKQVEKYIKKISTKKSTTRLTNLQITTILKVFEDLLKALTT